MTFNKTVDLPVGLDEAYALITQPERLRRWQTVSATVDLRVGGEFRWTVTPGHRAAGTFKVIEPGKRVVFGWGWQGEELAPDASTVTITLDPTDVGTRVTLIHEGLNEAQSAAHAEGWNHYLERLEKAASAGDAGADEWAWAPDPIDPLIAAEAALAVLQPVLRGLTAQDQPKPTPCADFTCHELAVHLFGSLQQLAAMAGATIEVPQDGPLETKVSVMAAQTIEAWLAYSDEMAVGGHLPSEMAKAIVALELLLHGWDLAQASGQEMRVSDELVAYVSQIAAPIIESARGRSFADAVEPAADASSMARFAAYAGRNPIQTRPDMQMPKHSDEDKQRFRDVIASLATESTGVEVKAMFGSLGAFVNGNMFAGLFGTEIGVKLDVEGTAELAAVGGGPFGPAERPMGGYLTVPDGADVTDWAARAAAYVGTFPPKAPKKK